MATYRNGESGEITLYIMEPEEEVWILRFIEHHQPDTKLPRTDLWRRPSLTEVAKDLGLQGGYIIQRTERR